MIHVDECVATNLARVRKEQGLSLDQLSRRSGVSKSMLRQIETGRSSPTIGVLWKIANGLRIPFTSLLETRSAFGKVTAFTSGQMLSGANKGYRLYPLVPFQPGRPMEIYYVEMNPGVAFDGEPHGGNARENVFVLDGKIRVNVGEEVLNGAEGTFIQFFAGSAHRYENPGRSITRVIMSIDYSFADPPGRDNDPT